MDVNEHKRKLDVSLKEMHFSHVRQNNLLGFRLCDQLIFSNDYTATHAR